MYALHPLLQHYVCGRILISRQNVGIPLIYLEFCQSVCAFAQRSVGCALTLRIPHCVCLRGSFGDPHVPPCSRMTKHAEEEVLVGVF